MKAVDGFVGQRVRMLKFGRKEETFGFWGEGKEGTVRALHLKDKGLTIEWDGLGRTVRSSEGDTLDYIEPTSPTVPPISKKEKGEPKMLHPRNTWFDRKQDGQSIFAQGRVTELYAAVGDVSYTVSSEAGRIYLVGQGQCSCPDYQYRRFDKCDMCKHLYAVAAFVAAKHPRYRSDEATVLSLVAAMETAATELDGWLSLRSTRAADALRMAVRAARSN